MIDRVGQCDNRSNDRLIWNLRRFPALVIVSCRFEGGDVFRMRRNIFRDGRRGDRLYVFAGTNWWKPFFSVSVGHATLKWMITIYKESCQQISQLKSFVMFAQKYFAGLVRAENIGMVSEGVNERNTSLRKRETS